MSQLAVTIDDKPLADAEGRALWTRFSTHMDANQGDFEGFAANEGYVEASVAVRNGVPTLCLRSKNAPKTPKPQSRPPKRRRRRRDKPDAGPGGSSAPRRKKR
jgi:hypothetical protein